MASFCCCSCFLNHNNPLCICILDIYATHCSKLHAPRMCASTCGSMPQHTAFRVTRTHMLVRKRVMRSGGTWSNTGFCTRTLETMSPSQKFKTSWGATILLNVSCQRREDMEVCVHVCMQAGHGICTGVKEGEGRGGGGEQAYSVHTYSMKTICPSHMSLPWLFTMVKKNCAYLVVRTEISWGKFEHGGTDQHLQWEGEESSHE